MTEKIEVLTHSSIRIMSDKGAVYIDPYQVREEYRDAAMIFVTHDHFDHFSVEDIAKTACADTILIAPEKMAETAKQAGSLVKEIVTVCPGQEYEVNGLAFEAVPSYNVGKPFHPKEAEWVGYILKMDGRRIYIAGDTDVNEDNKKLSCNIALVPIGGKFTMNAEEAAELVNAIKPEIAIPTHYGSVAGKKEDAEIFAKAVDPQIKVEIKMQY